MSLSVTGSTVPFLPQAHTSQRIKRSHFSYATSKPKQQKPNNKQENPNQNETKNPPTITKRESQHFTGT